MAKGLCLLISGILAGLFLALQIWLTLSVSSLSRNYGAVQFSKAEIAAAFQERDKTISLIVEAVRKLKPEAANETPKEPSQ